MTIYDKWIKNTGTCPVIAEEDLPRYAILYFEDGLSPDQTFAYDFQNYDWTLNKSDDFRNIYSYMIIGDQNGA